MQKIIISYIYLQYFHMKMVIQEIIQYQYNIIMIMVVVAKLDLFFQVLSQYNSTPITYSFYHYTDLVSIIVLTLIAKQWTALYQALWFK